MSVSLPDFKLEVFMARWEFVAPHNLTASDAESVTIAQLLDMGGPEQRERFEGLALGYTPTWGSEELLAAISRTYERVAPEHVLVFAGAEEAMFWALQELVGPGEHAVVTVPNYQSMETLTIATGARVDALPLRAEHGWALELDVLEGLIRPETRLVAVNFPNNPTGTLPDPDTFRRLAELCERESIVLFSDEVYRGLELDASRRLPQAADLSPSAVSLNVMSKSYGLPGLRIGWLACRDRALLERLERRKHYTSICSAGPSEALAAIALGAGEQIWERNRKIVTDNLPRFEEFFARWAGLFEWQAPAGGCVAFPRLLSGESTAAFCARVAEQAGVMLLPSEVYASELADVPQDRFRVGLGRAGAGAALDALDAHLQGRALHPV